MPRRPGGCRPAPRRRRPLGAYREIAAERLVAALDALPRIGGFLHSKKKAAGLRFVANDVDWSYGEGLRCVARPSPWSWPSAAGPQAWTTSPAMVFLS